MVLRATLSFTSLLHHFIPGLTLLLLPLLGYGQAGPRARTTAAVYTWSATGSSASWSDAASWAPSRTTPAATDVLQFTGTGAAPTALLDFASTQTIGKLLIQNGCTVTFSTDAERTLTVSDGGAGADLVLDNGSQLTLYYANSASLANANNGLTVKLGASATASIGGHLVLDAYQVNTNSNPTQTILQGNGTNSIEFLSGSVCTAQANFKGNAFGSSSTVPNSVVFRNGARYEHVGGSHPFGLSQPATITTFEPGSTYAFTPLTSSSPSLPGRTYGHLEYNMPSRSATASTGSGQVTIAGDLILTAGTVNINLASTIVLKGNVLLNGGALTFNPANGAAATVQFAGSAPQTLGGAGGSPTFGSSVTVQVANPAGLTLAAPLTLSGPLALTNGLLTTTASNILTLAQTATVSGGSGTSFVNGPVRRPIADISTATSFVFPVGKGAAYRPLTLTVSSQTGTTNYRAEQFEDNADRSLAPYDANDPAHTDLKRVSTLRYFSLTPYNSAQVPVVTQPSGFTGTVTLSYSGDDQVADPSLASLVVAKRSGTAQPWYDFGRSAYSGTATEGTLTSGTITSFSDFALGSTDPTRSTNPLPVQLTAFVAQRTAAGLVALAWTTASELHSAHFIAERSLDGRVFEPVAQVAAQGSSAQPRRYTARDEVAPNAPLYYRLKLVDQDGSHRYSPVVAIGAGTPGELVLSPNPARDQLSFYTERPLPYVLRSALGQVLRQDSTAGGLTQLDVRELAPGLYLLELYSGVGRVVQRFVKE